MSSEETPLLDPQSQHNQAYDRFSIRQKRIYVTVVSWNGLLPLFVSGSFVPSIPKIALDLDTTGPVISMAVSLSIFATAIGSLTCAAYSTFYGRRPIYLCSLPFLCVGSLGVASSKAVPELMAWRFFQTFGASGGLSVGAGVIADLYKLEERGTAMGVFYGATMLGPALAPVCGGLAAHYTSWRDMQYALGICGMIAFAAVAAFLPETAHPMTRGIDKLPLPQVFSGLGQQHRKFVWVNPLASLWLLRSPNLLAVGFVSTFALLTDYMLLIPLAYTIGRGYHITNEALIGACFIPAGLGNIVGGVFTGRLSDRILKKWRKRRGGQWVPEDRLRGAIFGAVILVPASILCSGLVTYFIRGKFGLALNFVCLFFNGIGLISVLSTSSAYAVDALHSRSAEAAAALNGFRAIVLAFGTTAILPLIECVGSVGANAIAAGLAWVGFGLLWLTIQYGDKMRDWVDIGYSTAESN